MKKYFKALDLLMAAAEYAQKGLPVKASKALVAATAAPDFEAAMNALNTQQATAKLQVEVKPEAKISQALAKLITAKNKAKPVTAAEDDQDEQDEQEEQDDEQEDDQDDSEESGLDDDMQDDDLDDELDMGILDGDDDEEEASDETQAPAGQEQSSVSARLARAERNLKRRG
jgi:hypothetical protein